MAALAEHARLPVFADGVYLTRVKSVDLKGESGQQRVETLEGLVGFSPGSGVTTVSLNLAVPIGGEEFPFYNRMVDGQIVSLQIGVGALAYVGNGKVMNAGFSQNVGNPTEQTVEWEGELKKLQ